LLKANCELLWNRSLTMRWRGERESENVEDERSSSGGGMMIGGGIGTLVLIVIALFLGVDPQALLQQVPQQAGPGVQRPLNPQEEEAKQFVAVVLADTEDVWNEQLRQIGKQYREPKLVLFAGRVNSACGLASAAVGPFYCPEDEKVYIDLAFFDELKRRFHAPGEFAQAYVIAHEVGHHVQKVLGISDHMRRMERGLSPEERNQQSVRLELQADFLAGVWAHHAQKMKQILEPGDIEAAIRAATAIGDDRLQMQGQGYVVPDSFTHGTSAQRVKWFKKGFETGDLRQGDTFNTDNL
jgi:predicted metalloprotease